MFCPLSAAQPCPVFPWGCFPELEVVPRQKNPRLGSSIQGCSCAPCSNVEMLPRFHNISCSELKSSSLTNPPIRAFYHIAWMFLARGLRGEQQSQAMKEGVCTASMRNHRWNSPVSGLFLLSCFA